MTRPPLDLGEQLEAYVERYQVEKSHRGLDAQLAVIRQGGPANLEVLKYCCAVPLARCANGAVRAGVPPARVMERYWQRLGQLSRLSSWRAVGRHLHRFADEMLEMVKPERRTDVERLVAHIRQDLSQRLDVPSTLQEYAAAAGLSRGYLSRCFARVAGRPFREELRSTRVQAACKLLRETPLKIGAVARQVGLRDVSQFIADFRRQTGLTPAVYRRRHHAPQGSGERGA